MAVDVKDLSIAGKDNTRNTENSKDIPNLGGPQTPPAETKITVTCTSQDGVGFPIANEVTSMALDGASATAISDTNAAETNSGSSVPKDVTSGAQPEMTTGVGAEAVKDTPSLEVPCKNPAPVSLTGNLNPQSTKDTSEEKAAGDFRSANAEIIPQEPAIGIPEIKSVSPSASAFTAQQTGSATTEPPITEEAPSSKGKATSEEKPSRKSLLNMSTGAEPMQARASTLYMAVAKSARMSELDVHSPGPSVPLNALVLDAVKRAYIEHDAAFQRAVAAHAANPALNITRDEYRACERTRKRIDRAMDDLIAMGAVETDNNGDLVALKRLPEIQRTLAGCGVTKVRLCPGGKRQMCDGDGNEINLALGVKANPAEHPERDDKAA